MQYQITQREGIREILACGIRNPGLWIRNSAQGIPATD